LVRGRVLEQPDARLLCVDDLRPGEVSVGITHSRTLPAVNAEARLVRHVKGRRPHTTCVKPSHGSPCRESRAFSARGERSLLVERIERAEVSALVALLDDNLGGHEVL